MRAELGILGLKALRHGQSMCPGTLLRKDIAARALLRHDVSGSLRGSLHRGAERHLSVYNAALWLRIFIVVNHVDAASMTIETLSVAEIALLDLKTVAVEHLRDFFVLLFNQKFFLGFYCLGGFFARNAVTDAFLLCQSGQTFCL